MRSYTVVSCNNIAGNKIEKIKPKHSPFDIAKVIEKHLGFGPTSIIPDLVSIKHAEFKTVSVSIPSALREVYNIHRPNFPSPNLDVNPLILPAKLEYQRLCGRYLFVLIRAFDPSNRFFLFSCQNSGIKSNIHNIFALRMPNGFYQFPECICRDCPIN